VIAARLGGLEGLLGAAAPEEAGPDAQ